MTAFVRIMDIFELWEFNYRESAAFQNIPYQRSEALVTFDHL